MDLAGIVVGALLLVFSLVEAAVVMWKNAPRWMFMQACGFSQLAMVILVAAVLGKGPIQLGLMILFSISSMWFFALQIIQVTGRSRTPSTFR